MTGVNVGLAVVGESVAIGPELGKDVVGATEGVLTVGELDGSRVGDNDGSMDGEEDG